MQHITGFYFVLLAPQELLIYEMAENGKNCDQRRVAMNKEQYNGNFTGEVWWFGGRRSTGLNDIFFIGIKQKYIISNIYYLLLTK